MKHFFKQILCATVLVLAVAAGEAAAAEQWREAEFEGLKVAYLEAGPKEAPALVFIHGWACDSSFWRLQTPAFAKDYRVILVDLPGFGKSGKPHDRAYTMDFLARSVQAVIADAEASHPVLIGHSMGYAVIRQYLLTFPGQAWATVNVDGAFLRIPPTAEARAGFEEFAAGMIAGFEGEGRAQAVAQFVESTFYGKTPEPLRAGIMAAMSSADEYAANSAMREFVRLEQWTDVSFDLPSLALYSSAGQLGADHESYLRQTFPKLTYTLWDDSGHYLMLEQPERFNAALADFFKTLQ
ncbi:MAG: alpha/beta hydrolase [Candidatus Adiutrix sp.]|jgi:pimeloyl-ACP methyl ester carboxylesterase|nr:alpha/beta hydrolase [Candidatus Adiutrix sp.]